MKKNIVISLAIVMGLLAGCQQQADMAINARNKSLTIEAQTSLPAMAASQTGYKAMNQKYAATFAEMDFSLMGQNQNYSYFMGDDVMKGGRGPDKLPPGLTMIAPTADTFLIYAVAKFSEDPKDTKLDIWKIDQNSSISRVRNGI